MQRFKIQALWAECLHSKPSSATYELCDFGQVPNLYVSHFSPPSKGGNVTVHSAGGFEGHRHKAHVEQWLVWHKASGELLHDVVIVLKMFLKNK